MAIKLIKRKSAVRPITGSIVDSTNIDDKTKNTYSANTIDGLIATNTEDIATINNIIPVDIGVLFQLNSGYTTLDHNIYKDRNRYFGYMTIQKTSGNFQSSPETVASVLKVQKSGKYLNTGCFLSNGQWSTSGVGHMILDWEKLQVSDMSGTGFQYNTAKIYFDIVTA